MYKQVITSLRLSENYLNSLTNRALLAIIFPSLTLVKVKNGYKPSKYGHCSRFPFCSDMYYIISVLILFALYL